MLGMLFGISTIRIGILYNLQCRTVQLLFRLECSTRAHPNNCLSRLRGLLEIKRASLNRHLQQPRKIHQQNSADVDGPVATAAGRWDSRTTKHRQSATRSLFRRPRCSQHNTSMSMGKSFSPSKALRAKELDDFVGEMVRKEAAEEDSPGSSKKRKLSTNEAENEAAKTMVAVAVEILDDNNNNEEEDGKLPAAVEVASPSAGSTSRSPAKRGRRSANANPLDEKWMMMFEQLKIYMLRNGKAPPYDHKEPLACWVASQRRSFITERIHIERKKMLDTINFVWRPSKRPLRSPPKEGGERPSKKEMSPEDLQWQETLKKLRAYKRQHKGEDINEPANEESLAAWVREQKERYSKGELTKTRTKSLVNLGVKFPGMPDPPPRAAVQARKAPPPANANAVIGPPKIGPPLPPRQLNKFHPGFFPFNPYLGMQNPQGTLPPPVAGATQAPGQGPAAAGGPAVGAPNPVAGAGRPIPMMPPFGMGGGILPVPQGITLTTEEALKERDEKVALQAENAVLRKENEQLRASRDDWEQKMNTVDQARKNEIKRLQAQISLQDKSLKSHVATLKRQSDQLQQIVAALVKGLA